MRHETFCQLCHGNSSWIAITGVRINRCVCFGELELIYRRGRSMSSLHETCRWDQLTSAHNQPHTLTPGAASDPLVTSVYMALDQRTTGQTHVKNSETRAATTWILLSLYYGLQTRFKINHFPYVNASDNTTCNKHQSWKMLPLMGRIKWMRLMTNLVGWRWGKTHTINTHMSQDRIKLYR